MATIPTMNAFTAGEYPTAAKLNANTRTGYNFLLSPPSVYLKRSAVQNIANATFTTISWDLEVFDTDAMFTSGTDITVKTPGLWFINVNYGFNTNATGVRMAEIILNGASEQRFAASAITGFNTVVNGSHVLRLSLNDIVKLNVYQNSGAALDTAGGALQPRIQMIWLGA